MKEVKLAIFTNYILLYTRDPKNYQKTCRSDKQI